MALRRRPASAAGRVVFGECLDGGKLMER